MKKVLVPIDFSDLSKEAMKFAIEFCELIHGEITILHVLEIPMTDYSYTGEVGSSSIADFYTHEYIDGLHKKLESWKEEYSSEAVPINLKMMYGNPYKKITHYISEQNADLIVMGSSGTSGMMEVLVGSNAERVVRHANCPVLIVQGETHIKAFKNLLFVTDASKEQDRLIDQVQNIQQLLGLNLHLLKVRTHYNMKSDKEVKAEIEGFAKRNGLENYTVNTTSADYVEDGVLPFAEEIDAGVIIIGTHGRKGIAHLIGGSKAEDLVNAAKTPIMTLKIDPD
ncbi:MAG: universal stress protein [Bacteroidota bacterium]